MTLHSGWIHVIEGSMLVPLLTCSLASAATSFLGYPGWNWDTDRKDRHGRIKWVLQVIGEVRKLLVQNQKEQKGLLRRKRTDFNLLWLVSLLHYLQDDRQCLSSFPHDLCCLLSGGVLGGSSPQLAVIYLLQVFSKSSPSQSLPWSSCSKLVQNFSTLSDSNTS